MRQRCSLRCGFSLVELLVVIGILGLLFALLFPAIQQVRESAARAACLSNLRQIGVALHNFHTAHGRLPPLPFKRVATDRNNPNLLLRWWVTLLPQMEQDSLWSATEQACRASAKPWENPPHLGFNTVIKSYVCPSDGRLLSPLTDRDGMTAGYTSYMGIMGGKNSMNGVMVLGGITFDDITDGASNTLMVGERPPPATLQAGQWYAQVYFATGAYGTLRGPDGSFVIATSAIYPGDFCRGPFRFGPGRLDNPCDRYHFWSLHPGGGNFLFADGSARYLAYSAEPIMVPLATRNGGELVHLPE